MQNGIGSVPYHHGIRVGTQCGLLVYDETGYAGIVASASL